MKVTNGASITSKGNNITLTNDLANVARGCQFRTNSGRWVFDWAMGLHGALDGHSPSWWCNALAMVSVSNAPSIPSDNERSASELLGRFYPGYDSVRWFTDGSNPNEAAVRLARAATGRNVIAFQGYHGYGTSFPHNPDANDLHVDERRGIPSEMWELTRQFNWGDYAAVNNLGTEVAAIVVEVPPQDGDAYKFLAHCYARSRAIGALMILDEVVTGFRVAKSGAVERYSADADLVCLGKAIGNGFNVSALVGRAGVMDYLTKGVHYSATFNGNGLATGMAEATMQWILDTEPKLYSGLYARGFELKQGMNQVFEDAGVSMRMVGNETRPIIKGFEPAFATEFRRKMYAKGFYILMAPWYVTTQHTHDVIQQTCDAAAESLKELKNEWPG